MTEDGWVYSEEAVHRALRPPTTIYVNREGFEMQPGDALEVPVVWRFPFLELTLTLRVSLVDDRVVRLDSERRGSRRRAPRRLWRLARSRA